MTLYNIIWYYMILFDIVWYYIIILYDIIWYCMISYDIIWYHMILYDIIISCDIIWHYTILYEIGQVRLYMAAQHTLWVYAYILYTWQLACLSFFRPLSWTQLVESAQCVFWKEAPCGPDRPNAWGLAQHDVCFFQQGPEAQTQRIRRVWPRPPNLPKAQIRMLVQKDTPNGPKGYHMRQKAAWGRGGARSPSPRCGFLHAKSC
jgi:hypothetical protein